jgi:hypothetical protein
MVWMLPVAPVVSARASSVVSADSVSESDSSFSAVPAELLSIESQNNDVLSSWGKTFHYLGHLPVSDLVPEEVIWKPTQSSTDLAAMDILLDGVDFDALVHELFDNEVSLADLLDRAIE